MFHHALDILTIYFKISGNLKKAFVKKTMKLRITKIFLLLCLFTSCISVQPCVVVLLAMAAMMQSCRTVAPCVPDTIVRDIVRVEYKLDSVYLYERDSIFVHEKRDTVFVERWKTRYKDVVKIQHDTIRDTKTDVQVKQVTYVTNYYKFCSLAFWIVVAILFIRLAWWIAKKYYGR